MNRELFPGLRGVHYLDNAAMTLKPIEVLDTVRAFSEKTTNVHRGLYRREEETTTAFETARETIARFLNAQPEEIVFTSGTTAGINMLARALEENTHRRNIISTTILEHHSNLIPWQQLAKRKKAKLHVANTKPIANEEVETDANIIAITHTSNALGTKLPVRKIFSKARRKGAITILDAAQAAAHEQLDVKTLSCDALALSGHKIYSPTGTGVLYINKKIHNTLSPAIFGGGMITTATTTKATWNEPPWKYEGGTPNIEGAIGLAAGITYLKKTGFARIQRRERALATHCYEELSRIPHVTLHSPKESPILSYTIDNVHPHDAATLLNEHKVCVRAGHHCAMPLMNALNIAGTIRASIAHYNTEEDINALITGTKDTIKRLRP